MSNSMIDPDKSLVKYEEHYSESKLWKKLKKTAQKVGLKAVYCALILFYALDSPNISSKDKAMIIGALGYFILPLDLIPDFLPAAGFTDDVAALLLAVYKLAGNITPEVKQRALIKLHDWFGDYDKTKIDI